MSANKLELEVFRNFKFENKVMGLTLLVVSENIRIVISTSFQVLGAIIEKTDIIIIFLCFI